MQYQEFCRACQQDEDYEGSKKKYELVEKIYLNFDCFINPQDVFNKYNTYGIELFIALDMLMTKNNEEGIPNKKYSNFELVLSDIFSTMIEMAEKNIKNLVKHQEVIIARKDFKIIAMCDDYILAKNSSEYVTWQIDHDGKRVNSGKYFDNLEDAKINFAQRADLSPFGDDEAVNPSI